MKVRTQEGLPEESASTLGQRGDEEKEAEIDGNRTIPAYRTGS